MANLRKCSRCKSEIDISYFGMNRKKEPYKTCDNCRKQHRTYNYTYRESHEDEIKEYGKQYKKDNREYYNNLTKLSKIKRLATPCEDGFQRCTGCAYAKDLSHYGQYLNSSEEVVRYVQCIDCRNTKDAWVLKNKSACDRLGLIM